jgi:hypothetical protein
MVNAIEKQYMDEAHQLLSDSVAKRNEADQFKSAKKQIAFFAKLQKEIQLTNLEKVAILAKKGCTKQHTSPWRFPVFQYLGEGLSCKNPALLNSYLDCLSSLSNGETSNQIASLLEEETSYTAEPGHYYSNYLGWIIKRNTMQLNADECAAAVTKYLDLIIKLWQFKVDSKTLTKLLEPFAQQYKDKVAKLLQAAIALPERIQGFASKEPSVQELQTLAQATINYNNADLDSNDHKCQLAKHILTREDYPNRYPVAKKMFEQASSAGWPNASLQLVYFYLNGHDGQGYVDWHNVQTYFSCYAEQMPNESKEKIATFVDVLENNYFKDTAKFTHESTENIQATRIYIYDKAIEQLLKTQFFDKAEHYFKQLIGIFNDADAIAPICEKLIQHLLQANLLDNAKIHLDKVKEKIKNNKIISDVEKQVQQKLTEKTKAVEYQMLKDQLKHAKNIQELENLVNKGFFLAYLEVAKAYAQGSYGVRLNYYTSVTKYEEAFKFGLANQSVTDCMQALEGLLNLCKLEINLSIKEHAASILHKCIVEAMAQFRITNALDLIKQQTSTIFDSVNSELCKLQVRILLLDEAWQGPLKDRALQGDSIALEYQLMLLPVSYNQYEKEILSYLEKQVDEFGKNSKHKQDPAFTRRSAHMQIYACLLQKAGKTALCNKINNLVYPAGSTSAYSAKFFNEDASIQPKESNHKKQGQQQQSNPAVKNTQQTAQGTSNAISHNNSVSAPPKVEAHLTDHEKYVQMRLAIFKDQLEEYIKQRKNKGEYQEKGWRETHINTLSGLIVNYTSQQGIADICQTIASILETINKKPRAKLKNMFNLNNNNNNRLTAVLHTGLKDILESNHAALLLLAGELELKPGEMDQLTSDVNTGNNNNNFNYQ